MFVAEFLSFVFNAAWDVCGSKTRSKDCSLKEAISLPIHTYMRGLLLLALCKHYITLASASGFCLIWPDAWDSAPSPVGSTLRSSKQTEQKQLKGWHLQRHKEIAARQHTCSLQVLVNHSRGASLIQWCLDMPGILPSSQTAAGRRHRACLGQTSLACYGGKAVSLGVVQLSFRRAQRRYVNLYRRDTGGPAIWWFDL